VVSKFILNLFYKGSINLNQGRLYLWNNPFIFIPISSFALLQKELIALYGKEGREILYWLGRIQGNNSTKIIMNRFGYKPSEENFKYFVDGSTMVGMGTMNLVSYKTKMGKGKIVCTDSPLSKIYLEKFGEQSFPVENYMCGILSGGAEPLVGYPLRCDEKECISQGHKECIYEFCKIKEYKSGVSLKLQEKVKNLIQNSTALFIRRKNIIERIFGKQLVSFSEGSLFINKIKGLILPTYLFAILDAFMKEKKETYQKIFEKIGKEYVSCLSIVKKPIPPSSKDVDKYLDFLDSFGLGKFRLISAKKGEWIIENNTSPYPLDYKFIFGKQKEGIDILALNVLKGFIEKTFDLKTKITEISCLSKGDKNCRFKINF
jgi:predicted hydrocarbon binding protein